MSRGRRRLLLLAAALGLALAALAFGRATHSRDGAHDPRPPEAAPAPPAAAATAPGAAEAPIAPSLRGTDPDGELLVGPDGHLLPTPGALLLFDHFLAATGEAPGAEIRAAIVREIGRRVPPGAAAEAEALLDRYLRYREAARTLGATDPGDVDLERRVQRLRELRRAIFGAEEAAALFGDEERITNVALERRRIAEDTALAPEERERRLEALDASLPEAERAARAEAIAPLRVERDVAALRAAGASEGDVRRVREQAFGAEAADRLAALDAERADFERRLASYRTARDAVRGDPALSASEREAALEALRAERFETRDLARVRAFDAAEAPTAPVDGADTRK